MSDVKEAPATGEQPSTPPSAPIGHNKPFDAVVKEQCTFWQDVLRLRDWNIDVRVARNHEMDGSISDIRYFTQRRDAIMRVMHPMDIPAIEDNFLEGEARDYDLAIVHELLHLHFSPFAAKDDSHESLTQEQAIESISRAIVRLYREQNPILIAMPPAQKLADSGVGHYL